MPDEQLVSMPDEQLVSMPDEQLVSMSDEQLVSMSDEQLVWKNIDLFVLIHNTVLSTFKDALYYILKNDFKLLFQKNIFSGANFLCSGRP